jgi:hypothetical protein
VQDAHHPIVRGEEVVGFERVDDTLFGLTEVAGVGDSAEHEESHVVRIDGSRDIYHLAGLVIAVDGLTHEVGLLCK